MQPGLFYGMNGYTQNNNSNNKNIQDLDLTGSDIFDFIYILSQIEAKGRHRKKNGAYCIFPLQAIKFSAIAYCILDLHMQSQNKDCFLFYFK